jgi:hypothetical protein
VKFQFLPLLSRERPGVQFMTNLVKDPFCLSVVLPINHVLLPVTRRAARRGLAHLGA